MSKETPDYLKTEEETTDVTTQDMASLDSLINQYNVALAEKEEAEAILKDKKAVFNNLVLTVLPDFFLSHGITKMTLKDGRDVKVKEDVSATISDEWAFREWLRERGEAAIIKTKYEFGEMTPAQIDKLSDFLEDGEFDFSIDESINSNTKAAYFRRLVKTMNREDLPDWVSIYDIRKATIKKLKK